MIPFNNTNLSSLLQHQVITEPDRVIYIYLNDDGSIWKEVTYRDLDQNARRIGSYLKRKYEPGTRAILLYPHTPEFIYAFLGCIYAGMIPVPANPPTRRRHFTRLTSIADGSGAKVILTNSLLLGLIGVSSIRKGIRFVSTERISSRKVRDFEVSPVNGDSIAFLQFTSGSTGDPKGVMIHHQALLYNVWTILASAGVDNEDDKVLSWLPTFHDMGLVVGLILPIYSNLACYHLSPLAFLKNTAIWFQCMSKYKVHFTAAPNFALGMCLGKVSDSEIETMDLSHVKQIYCGGEPVRKKTIEGFLGKFAKCGLSRTTIYPCYGMAESVLMTTVDKLGTKIQGMAVDRDKLKKGTIELSDEEEDKASYLYSCGQVWGDTDIKIVNPESLKLCNPFELGEIWVKGSTVAQGYWNKPEVTAKVFQASIPGTDLHGYLRTGDIGVFYNDRLYVTGRLKDIMIIRGRNFFPEDLEHAAEGAHNSMRLNNCAVFSVEDENEEKIVLVQEIRDEYAKGLNKQEVIQAIRSRITEEYDIDVHSICLLPSRKLPKTTSGKIQRNICKQKYVEGKLEYFFQWKNTQQNDNALPQININLREANRDELLDWLIQLIGAKADIAPELIDVNAVLSDLGVDSVNVVEITDIIERKMNVALPPNFFWDYPTLSEAVNYLLDEGEFTN